MLDLLETKKLARENLGQLGSPVYIASMSCVSFNVSVPVSYPENANIIIIIIILCLKKAIEQEIRSLTEHKKKLQKENHLIYKVK